VGHFSVPLLKVAANDDFMVFGQFARNLNLTLTLTVAGQNSPKPSSKMMPWGLLRVVVWPLALATLCWVVR
jgi:hypothetical protein